MPIPPAVIGQQPQAIIRITFILTLRAVGPVIKNPVRALAAPKHVIAGAAVNIVMPQPAINGVILTAVNGVAAIATSDTIARYSAGYIIEIVPATISKWYAIDVPPRKRFLSSARYAAGETPRITEQVPRSPSNRMLAQPWMRRYALGSWYARIGTTG